MLLKDIEQTIIDLMVKNDLKNYCIFNIIMNIKDIYAKWEKLVDKNIDVSGWLEFKRESNEKFFFIVLRDGSCFNNLQCICDISNFHSQDFFQNLKSINRGSGVKLSGKIVKSPAKGQKFELKVIDGAIYGNVADTYPLQKSRTLRCITPISSFKIANTNISSLNYFKKYIAI